MESLTQHADYKDFVRYFTDMVERNGWEGDYLWFLQRLGFSHSTPTTEKLWHQWVQLYDLMQFLQPDMLYHLTVKEVGNEQRNQQDTRNEHDDEPRATNGRKGKKHGRQSSDGGLPF